MIPPTSIDGTDITGATIDGTDVTEITVDGDVVFSAIPNIIDNFNEALYEDKSNTLSDYYFQDVGSFNRVSNGAVFEGSHSLQVTTKGVEIYSTSGLPRYPQAGEVFSARCNLSDTSGIPILHFGVQDANNYYLVRPRTQDNTLEMAVTSAGQNTLLAQTSVSIPTNEWLLNEVEWQTNGTITYTLFDANGSQIDSITGNDTQYTGGGVGFSQFNAATDERWDDLRVTGQI